MLRYIPINIQALPTPLPKARPSQRVTAPLTSAPLAARTLAPPLQPRHPQLLHPVPVVVPIRRPRQSPLRPSSRSKMALQLPPKPVQQLRQAVGVN